MRVSGLVKNSFLDFPGLIAAVVFVPGCNMDCWYCHNKHLWKSGAEISEGELEGFLDSHKGFLDAVVVSGGEPTLQPGLSGFIKGLKSKGYRVKLDTNGTNPAVVKKLLPLLDYAALDLKAPPGELSRVVSFDMDDSPVWETAEILMGSGIEYEFRTTMMPLLDARDIEAIAKRVKGAKRYAIQQYRKAEGVRTGAPKSKAIWGVLQPEPLKADHLKKAAEAARKYVEEVIIRGI